MPNHYKLFKIRELADGDDDFIQTLAQTFLEEVSEDLEKLKTAVLNKSYEDVYQTAHKMKPTVDLFELGILQNVINVQDWGKNKESDVDISSELGIVVTVINNALAEIETDFNL